MNDLSRRISNLSPEKRALLEKRLQQSSKSALATEFSIPKRDHDGPAPLSFMQERLWFLHQLYPGLTAYNEASTYALHGQLDVRALQRSFEVVVERHEILRTVFREMDGKPVQVVQPAAIFHLELVDVVASPQEDRENKVKSHIERLIRKPYNLASDSMVKVVLYHLERDENILLCIIHHLATDGWSMALFWNEIFKVYDAETQGKQAILPELPIQYADFATWQRRWFEGEVMRQQLEYWRKALQGLSSPELPVDRPRATMQTYRGVELRRKIPLAAMQNVYELSRRENVTPYMVLLATFFVLVSRLTGQEDVSVGTPVVNRRFVELEPLMGFFVNTLVARIDLSGDPSFREVLGQVRSMLLDMFDHQEMPFEKLVEELQPEHQLNRTPFFQAFFNFISRRNDHYELEGLQVERMYMVERSAKFDLTLYVFESSTEMELDLTYNVDLFVYEHMDELLNQYIELLEQVLEKPEISVKMHSLVTNKAKRIIPDPAADLPEPEMPIVTELFFRQVNQTPAAIAVEQGGQYWSYVQLAEQAQKLALELIAHGACPGQVTAVHGVRCFDLVASALAVLLSGGVLLLIDPDLPNARQEIMLQHSHAKYILRVDSEAHDSPTISLLDHSEEWVAETPPVVPGKLPVIKSDDQAYIFFTSGSTGVPKGIRGTHKGLSHFLIWQRNTFSIGKDDRVGQLTHLSFDVVLRDILTILISGGTLVLPPIEAIPPQNVLAWLAAQQITLLHCVPSLVRFWLESSTEPVHLPELRLTFFAGEILHGELVNRWRKHLAPECVVVNLYGPTETSLAKAFYRVPDPPDPGGQPVGVALPQTQLLVLNSNGKVCGIGEPGQVAIRTPFATLGYLSGTPEQVRFVPNHFRLEKPDSIYLTGDRGRYCLDGLLEILGRMDEQVKVRGVLVQPQEVAAALQAHPDIAGCFVRAFQSAQSGTELAAYVVPFADRNLKVDQVRTFLRGQLPQSLLPAALVLVEELPLLPNGKVDRSALPEPQKEIAERSMDFSPPKTPVEQALAQIWQDVLKVQQVGIHDNFFDLGGHSLRAAQVAARARDLLHVELPLRALFETPTVEELAQWVELLRNELEDKSKQNGREDVVI
jgi:amino acid adenylation domain-containing protein